MTETMKINLWTPHKNQKILVNNTSRYKVVVCGRRFGKTTYGVKTLVKAGLLKDNGQYFYVAPTYRQAKMIAWKMLQESYLALPPQLQGRINESELYIIIGNNTRIDIKGADNPDSLRGVGLDGIILDEYADIKPSVFEEIIQPALIDKEGWITFIGTPKGFNHFYDLFVYAQQHEDDGWKAFKFTSYDNPLINPAEIDKAKAQTTEDKFAQEYMADFRKMEGLVYKEFDRDTHLIDDKHVIKNRLEKIAGVDFGFTNPAVILSISRDNDNNYYVEDEWYHTGKVNAEIIEHAKTLDINLFYPDPAEPDRIEEMKRANLTIRDVNKDIEKGIDAVRTLFMNKKLFINKRCRHLIWELENYRYKEKKDNHNDPEVPVKENDHCVDALRYALFMNSPVNTDEQEEDMELYSESYI